MIDRNIALNYMYIENKYLYECIRQITGLPTKRKSFMTSL